MRRRLSSSPWVGREHQTAVGVQTARLPRERLDLAVQVDGVFLQARDVRFAVEGVHAAGGVPGRAGGELALLQQQHVAPADLGQVVEHARAHHAAADDDHSRRSLHDCTSPHSAARSTLGPLLISKGPGRGREPFAPVPRGARGRQDQHPGRERGENRRHLGDDCGGDAAGGEDTRIEIQAAAAGEHLAQRATTEVQDAQRRGQIHRRGLRAAGRVPQGGRRSRDCRHTQQQCAVGAQPRASVPGARVS